MKINIPLAPVAFPFVLSARLIGFVLGAVTTLSLIGLPLAGATGGFGWRREVTSNKLVANDPSLFRIQIRTTPGWYVRLFGGSTQVRDYMVSRFDLNNQIASIATPDGKEITGAQWNRMERMINLYQREYGNV